MNSVTPAALNIASMPTAACPRLLTPPSTRPEIMQAEIDNSFSYLGVSQAGKEKEISSTVKELGLLSPEWNTPYYDLMLFNHIEHFMDASKVHCRLAAEVDFFRRLYAPAERFSIYPVDEHKFDEDSIFSTIVLESGGRVYGCADFVSMPEAMVLEYIQGRSTVSAGDQRKALGKPWFEAFMDRAIESFARLNDMGVRMLLKIHAFETNGDDDFSPLFYLPRMVRDRYFEPAPDKSGELYALSFKKQRVKRILSAFDKSMQGIRP